MTFLRPGRAARPDPQGNAYATFDTPPTSALLDLETDGSHVPVRLTEDVDINLEPWTIGAMASVTFPDNLGPARQLLNADPRRVRIHVHAFPSAGFAALIRFGRTEEDVARDDTSVLFPIGAISSAGPYAIGWSEALWARRTDASVGAATLIVTTENWAR